MDAGIGAGWEAGRLFSLSLAGGLGAFGMERPRTSKPRSSLRGFVGRVNVKRGFVWTGESGRAMFFPPLAEEAA